MTEEVKQVLTTKPSSIVAALEGFYQFKQEDDHILPSLPSYPFLSLPIPSYPFLSLPIPSYPFLSLPLHFSPYIYPLIHRNHKAPSIPYHPSNTRFRPLNGKYTF
jgi:hypothetical protein